MEEPKPEGIPTPAQDKHVRMPEILKKAITKVPEEGAEKAAAIVARSFYREMKRYGFTSNQIIHVATELINCLSRGLKGYKAKMKNQ